MRKIPLRPLLAAAARRPTAASGPPPSSCGPPAVITAERVAATAADADATKGPASRSRSGLRGRGRQELLLSGGGCRRGRGAGAGVIASTERSFSSSPLSSSPSAAAASSSSFSSSATVADNDNGGGGEYSSRNPEPPQQQPPLPPGSPPITKKTRSSAADNNNKPKPKPNLPFRFETGLALFSKRTPRPFPPPFTSPPSGSFSDALSTHDRSRDRRSSTGYVNGHLIRGYTNGDDAVYASEYFICANDGVGAWSTRPRGHSGLWARLILHFWARAVCEELASAGAGAGAAASPAGAAASPAGTGADAGAGAAGSGGAEVVEGRGREEEEERENEMTKGSGCNEYKPDPVACLQRAFEETIAATSPPNDWQGTTTAAGAQIHFRAASSSDSVDDGSTATGGTSNSNSNSPGTAAAAPGEPAPAAAAAAAPAPEAAAVPILYVTNLGDSQVMVVRPSTGELVFKTKEQWHWFDCPRQLGTNSPDTPRMDAVLDVVEIREGDVVLAMSDGVIDNLWPHEIVERVCESVRRLEMERSAAATTNTTNAVTDGDGDGGGDGGFDGDGGSGMMYVVAQELVEAARVVAVDPFAESPFMEHAIEEGLPSEGGKLDDISVVAALCRRADR